MLVQLICRGSLKNFATSCQCRASANLFKRDSFHKTLLIRNIHFSARVRCAKKELKTSPEKVATGNAKKIPKASELRRLLKVAYPERWKIAGNIY